DGIRDLIVTGVQTCALPISLPHGLRACWSTPIFDAQRKVIGTFAIYYRRSGLPTERHLQLIRMATHAAAVGLAKHRATQALRERSEERRVGKECRSRGAPVV